MLDKAFANRDLNGMEWLVAFLLAVFYFTCFSCFSISCSKTHVL